MRTDDEHRAEFSDFTEAGYTELVRLAKRSYRFARYGDQGVDRHLLWRHDLDASVHRAVRLAQIEAEEGVTATYFLYPRCRYYNLLSTEVARAVSIIAGLGHDLALHFDPTHYGPLDRNDLLAAVMQERDLLEREFDRKLSAVSFHLFGVLKDPVPDDDRICGLVNAYSRSLQKDYDYCSDSNGIWYYRRLKAVLEAAEAPRLQILTHPEWWTPEAMAPRARMQRAIDGYARAMEAWYDDIVAASGRPNLR